MREKPETLTLLTIRRLGAVLFRIHIENGAFVSLGMAAVALGTAVWFGRDVAILAATGGLCASIVDQPGPLLIKARMFALAVGGATALTALTMLAGGAPGPTLALVAAMSFVSGLVTAYGRRAIGLGVAAVLALLFGMAAPAAAPLYPHVAIFAAGGIGYAVFALAASAALDDRNRRLFLGEAVRAFSAYIAAKSSLYDPRAPERRALQSLIEAHAAFTERLQAARDMIFTGIRTPRRMRWMAALLALLDCFDTVVSSDADIETLRRSAHYDLMHRLRALTADIARDTEELALALMTPGASLAFPDHAGQIAAIEEEIVRMERAAPGAEPPAVSAFRSTGHKLAQTVTRLERLIQAVDSRADAKAILPDVDLAAFVQRESLDPRVLTAQLKLSSPVMRYAVRLTLAMCCGYLLTLVLPALLHRGWMLHGGWVLLTTALIMRASYSITRQRRNDRIIGTVAGCVAAALLVYVLPRDWLFLPMLITIGSAHAFAAVDFRVTALSASITALLSLHYLAPETQAVFFERILDTLIGAGLAWLFSFLLPSWEWRNVPKLVAAKIGADRDYAGQALARQRDDHAYRLARKRAHDATANLSMTVRRLADEPRIEQRDLVVLNDLLAANYLLASDFASMRVLFRMRSKELKPAETDTLLDTARENVLASLAAHETKDLPARLSRRSLGKSLGGRDAMVSLRRRLIHIERTAARVGALAAKVTSSSLP